MAVALQGKQGCMETHQSFQEAFDGKLLRFELLQFGDRVWRVVIRQLVRVQADCTKAPLLNPVVAHDATAGA